MNKLLIGKIIENKMLMIKQHLPFVSKFHPYILASSKSCPEENYHFFKKKSIQVLCNNNWVLMPCDMSGKVAGDKLTSDTRSLGLDSSLIFHSFSTQAKGTKSMLACYSNEGVFGTM